MSVTGFDDLDRKLGRMAGGIDEAKQLAALFKGGQVIADEAQRLAPVDTGELQDSIKVVEARDGRLYAKVNTVPAAPADGVSIYVGPVGSDEEGDIFYARYQEFGTARNEAQPFMRPALAATRDEADRIVAAELRRDVLDLAR